MDRNICSDGTLATENNKCLIQWYSADNNSYGPVTAMNYLYNATKNWINVPNMDLSGSSAYIDEGNYEYSGYGYGKIETISNGISIMKKDKITEVTGNETQNPTILYDGNKLLKARLPKYAEIYNVDDKHCQYIAKCPSWLVEYLSPYSTFYSESNHISGIEGYWLMSSTPKYHNRARRLAYYGCVDDDGYSNGGSNSTSNFYGIRPVITVPKSYLSQN